MYHIKKDKRSIESSNMIYEGLKTLMINKNFEDIKITEIVKEAVAIDGFSVVIAKHPCMLKLTRQNRKKKSYKQRHVEIDQEICQLHNVCIEDFGCPSFSKNDEGQVVVNLDLCIGDGSCKQTCPISAIEYPPGEVK